MKRNKKAGQKSLKPENHVLDNIIIDNTREEQGWNIRVKEWYVSMSVTERMSWLHANVVRGRWNGPDQFIFFMDVADGYGSFVFNESRENGVISTSNPGQCPLWKQKELIAKKAFALLCTNFFPKKDGGEMQFPPALIYQRPLFAKLLWFFRPNVINPMGIISSNLYPRDFSDVGKDGGKYYIEVVRKFATRFVYDAWLILIGKPSLQNCDQGVVRPHFEEIVRLLCVLDQIDSVFNEDQSRPSKEVFMTMLHLAIKDGFKDTQSALSVYSMDALLEQLIMRNDKLASALYLARLRYR